MPRILWPLFSWTRCILSKERLKIRSPANLADTFSRVHPNTLKSIQILEKKERGRIQGLPKFFEYPLILIILGTGKATSFEFCTHILSIDRNKSPLEISGNVAVGVVRTLEIFEGTHILGASRGRLCDSSAFLFLNVASNRISTNFHHDSHKRCPLLRFVALPRCYKQSAVEIACRLSVRPSVMIRYCDHIGWNSSKKISLPNSLKPMSSLTPTWAIWCNGNTTKIRVA